MSTFDDIKKTFGEIELVYPIGKINYIVTKGFHVYREKLDTILTAYELVEDPPESIKKYIEYCKKLNK
jgi:hypothetical protein